MNRPTHSSNAKKTAQGFTLLEAVIAMAIVAVLATALLKITGGSVASESVMQEKTFEAIIASNTIIAMQQSGQWPSLDRTSQTTAMAGRVWRVDLEVAETADPFLRLLQVHVSSADSGHVPEPQSGFMLTGFVGRN